MWVKTHPSKASGPSGKGACKQMGVKTRPCKPSVLESVPNVVHNVEPNVVPNVLLESLPDALHSDITDVSLNNFSESSNKIS